MDPAYTGAKASGKLTARDLGALTPLFCEHSDPYDRFELDMNARLPRTPAAVRDRVTALKPGLDPVRLLAEIRAAQQQLVTIANKRATDGPSVSLN
jgi:hypothetical protein